MDQRQLFKQLDSAEGQVLTRWNEWLQDAFKSIPWAEYERLQRRGVIQAMDQAPAPITTKVGSLAKIINDHLADMLAAGRAHAQLLTNEIRQEPHKLADYPEFDFNYADDPRVIPKKAIKVMEARSIRLAGDVDGELLAGVKKIMVNFLSGESRQEAEIKLEGLLKANQDRASLITTTETTYSYNRGRLAGFAENRVDYVRFSAVMDGRTSSVCRSRHGLVMKMDDSRVADNTPPLHGRCRSVLDPVYSAYQPEYITDKYLDWSGAAPLPSGWKQ